MKKEFRDITAHMIIPKNVYEDNLMEINKNLEILNSLDSSHQDKLLSKIKIRELSLSIQEYEFKNKKNFSRDLEFIDLGKFEKIYILDCNYSFEKGFAVKDEKVKDLIDDRFL